MDLQSLRLILRYEYLDDSEAPFLWENGALERFINEACIEAALRSHCVQDRLAVAVVKGTAEYALPPSALHILNAQLDEQPKLHRLALADLERVFGFHKRTGAPKAYVFESIHHGGEGRLRLYPIPAEDGTLHLRYARMPKPLALPTDEPEIPAALHPHLLEYAAHRAYALRDSDAGDSERSLKHLMNFERHFGETLTHATRAARNEGKRSRVRINSDWR